MNSQRLYIVTGSSSGLGLEICKHLIKLNYKVLGISRSEGKINDSNYFHKIHDFKNKINIEDILNLKLNFKIEIYLILNAAQRFDSEYNENNIFDLFLKSFDINFYNQIDFINKINKEINFKKIFFISSFSIFTSGNETKDIGYYLAKDNLYKMTLLINKHYKINSTCVMIGAMETKLLNEKPSTVASIPIIGKFLEKKLSLSSQDVAKKIIKNSDNNKDVILIPYIPIFLLKFLIKIIEIIRFKK